MTRKEEILKAARDYVNGVTLSSPSKFIHFAAGARWADEHPNLLSLWHDASEEPQIGSNIVVVDEKGQLWDIQPYDGEYDGYGGLTGWRCCVVHYNNIQSWAYIKDLLPKEGER